MNKETMVIGIVAVLFVSIIFVASFYNSPVSEVAGIKRFSSYNDLESFVKSNMEVYGYYGTFAGGVTKQTAVAESMPAAAPTDSGRSSDYSTTNIQVEGVDEADIVKNDGKYIYVVSGRKVVIIDAYPAEAAKNVSEIMFNGNPQQIFVNDNKLIVFGWEDYYSEPGISIPELGIMPRYGYTSRTFINVYDITDKSNPILTRNISVDGNYFQSRMIGDYVYAIVNQNVYYSYPQPIPMPVIRSGGVEKTIAATEIYYFDYPDSSYIFTNVVSLNAQDDAEEIKTKTFLMGYSENMYVSTDNVYIVYTKRLSEYDFYDRIVDDAIIPSVPLDVQNSINSVRNSDIEKYKKIQEIGKVFQNYIASLNPEEAANVMRDVELRAKKVQEDIAKEMEKTVVHKVGIQNGNIEYKANGEVPGYVLNQFSMDEYNSNFRIATTTGNWRSDNLNHVYILDSNLQIIGSLEDLARDERIYSVRFLGDKGYMVTFRQVDPLFVIDLSDPNNPTVLGFLKIPGVSDYLHPYDGTHIIGIGRNATEQGMISGMKLSLFDISDFSNPKEMSNFVIGGDNMYVSSDALYDHKAFLFDKEKQLMAIPVSINTYSRGHVYEYYYWQGAYVFSINLASGITVKGNITHMNRTNETDYYSYGAQIRRSLYIDNVLYTISGAMVKMNDLGSLQEINKVWLPFENYGYPYPIKTSSGSETVAISIE